MANGADRPRFLFHHDKYSYPSLNPILIFISGVSNPLAPGERAGVRGYFPEQRCSGEKIVTVKSQEKS
jgi:hypothetical protein